MADIPWVFVEAAWNDANSTCDWCSLTALPKLTPVITRGWLVSDTADTVTLAGSYQWSNDQHDVGEVISIPRGCLVSLTELPIQKNGAVIYDFETGLKSE